ncbi:MAG: glycosyltransferase family 39 protein [Candidatus Hinthialibacter antarcticus]|nr:glycosyltransferase family 39 protein [Candidatus Hinthialibacter antarcticus]
MTQMLRNPRIAMTALLLLGFLLRVVGLEYCPPAMNSDELLKAFDGASVYLTGMDHHGARWPLFFKQSGEYSPPLYIYFSGLFSAPFGVNPYTLRLPSAILGTLCILLAYLAASRWRDQTTGWIAAALVALSPWNVHYSRIGWEAISLIPLQLCGLWLFLRWTQEDRKADLFLSASVFALTTYAYPTARLFTPIIGVGLLLCFFPKLKEKPKQSALGAGLFLLLQIPLVYALLTNYEAMQARWNFVSVFNHPDGIGLAAANYIKHLSPLFLFVTGNTNPGHQLPGGLALLVLAPFFVMGLVAIAQRKSSGDWLMVIWFLTFAIPSSLTYDRFDPASMPNALRSVNGMPILELIAAAGIGWLLQRVPKEKRYALGTVIAAAVIVNAGYIGYQTATVYPKQAARQNQYGMEEVIEYAEANKANYDRVVISHNVRLHPISLAVFSGRKPGPFSAKDYPKYVIPFYHYVPVYGDFRTDVYQRYAGQNLNSIARWYNLAPGKNLLIALPDEIGGAAPIHQIISLDGSVAYAIYETVN